MQGSLEQVFNAIVREYSERLWWHIRRMVGSHEDTDDLLQEIFLKIWTALPSFRGESQLFTWLYRIAINESLDFVRHQKSASMTSADDDTGIANTLMADQYFDGDETEAQLQEAIAQLPDVQRTVFNLRYYDEMKYNEMSKVLNTSEGALKASYHIAVKKISDFFKQRD